METCRSAPLLRAKSASASASAGAARHAPARRGAARRAAAAAAAGAVDVGAWNAKAKAARLAALEAEAMGAIKQAVENFDHPVFPCAFIAGDVVIMHLIDKLGYLASGKVQVRARADGLMGGHWMLRRACPGEDARHTRVAVARSTWLWRGARGRLEQAPCVAGAACLFSDAPLALALARCHTNCLNATKESKEEAPVSPV